MVDHVDDIKKQWQAERPDLDVSPMGITGRIGRFSSFSRQKMEQTFRAFDLNGASFDLLATLLRAGPPYALSPSELLAASMITSGTMTNRIDQLEKAKLVLRKKCPEDGRSCHVSLTNKGHRLINDAVKSHVETLHKITGHISAKDRATLERILKDALTQFEKENSSI